MNEQELSLSLTELVGRLHPSHPASQDLENLHKRISDLEQRKRKSVLAEIHARHNELQNELANDYHQIACFLKYGSRMQLKPGWQRPRLVDVICWGHHCLVKCVETGRKYAFPRHQLEKPCWRCFGHKSVFAPTSGEFFSCPVCKKYTKEDTKPYRTGEKNDPKSSNLFY